MDNRRKGKRNIRITVFVILCLMLCGWIQFPSFAEHSENDSSFNFLRISVSSPWQCRLEVVDLCVEYAVKWDEFTVLIPFCAHSAPGSIYGILITDTQKILKCKWGVLGAENYYVRISTNDLMQFSQTENLRLIVVSQMND